MKQRVVNDFLSVEVYFSKKKVFIKGNSKKKDVSFWLFCIVFLKKTKIIRMRTICTQKNCVRKKGWNPWFYSENYHFWCVCCDGFLTKAGRWTNGTEKNRKRRDCWQYCINPVLFTVRYVLEFVHTVGKLVFFQKEGVRDRCSRQKEHAGRSKWLFFDKKYNR